MQQNTVSHRSSLASTSSLMIKKPRSFFCTFEGGTELIKKTLSNGELNSKKFVVNTIVIHYWVYYEFLWDRRYTLVHLNQPLCKRRIEMLKWKQGGSTTRRRGKSKTEVYEFELLMHLSCIFTRFFFFQFWTNVYNKATYLNIVGRKWKCSSLKIRIRLQKRFQSIGVRQGSSKTQTVAYMAHRNW